MGRLNPEADLLKRCLHAYSSWLDWQRAAAAALAAAHGPAAVAEGPPAGGFSHRKAVDAWVALIPKVIHAGGWFLLQARLVGVAGLLCPYGGPRSPLPSPLLPAACGCGSVCEHGCCSARAGGRPAHGAGGLPR